jgi:uncharacterized protein (TIGR02588 family)
MSSKSMNRPPAGKNPLEWAVFALSFLLVLGVVGILAEEALRWQDSPARLTAQIGGTALQGGARWVTVEVRNDGEGLAADVEIEVQAGDESAGFTLDFVPRGTVRSGRVSFPQTIDPATAVVSIRGYREP